MLNWQPKKPTLSPNWKRLILRPLLILRSASRMRKPMQEVAISALAAERLSAWWGHRRPRVAITEWESLEKAEAFFKSKAWTDLGADRDKALKTIRRYAVEAAQ